LFSPATKHAIPSKISTGKIGEAFDNVMSDYVQSSRRSD
jgi:hypothetical protein